jgi:hypothetical protein
MSAASRPELFIIESLDLKDEKADSFEGRRISQLLHLSGKFCEYVYIRTERELREILKEFKRSRYRYLHVSCHGGTNNEDNRCIWTTFDDIDFVKAGRIFAPYINERLVFVSACQAASMSLASSLMSSTTCYSVMAPTNDIKAHDAAFFWATFYHLMFKRNDRSMKREVIREVGAAAAKLFQVRIKLFARDNGKIAPYTLR